MTLPRTKGLSEASYNRLAATYFGEDDPYSEKVVKKQDAWMRMKDKKETNLENWKSQANGKPTNYPHKESSSKTDEIDNSENLTPVSSNSTLTKSRSKSPLASKQNSHTSRTVKSQSDPLSDSPILDNSFDFSSFPEEGKIGFSEAKSLILEMIQQGFEDVDILIQVNERFTKDVSDMALQECRRKGLI